MSSTRPLSERALVFVVGAVMSAQSATSHLASAAGAMASSIFLRAEPSGRLIGMGRVALASALLALLVPAIAFMLERRVRRREALG
jgi:hypothetical protein